VVSVLQFGGAAGAIGRDCADCPELVVVPGDVTII
jgi:hypothetical protein